MLNVTTGPLRLADWSTMSLSQGITASRSRTRATFFTAVVVPTMLKLDAAAGAVAPGEGIGDATDRLVRYADDGRSRPRSASTESHLTLVVVTVRMNPNRAATAACAS